jgi:hypothetical protein
VYLGLAIWLSTVTFDLFKVLFLENRHPMSISESGMPMLALILCTGVTIIIAVVAVQQFIRPDSKKEN